MSRSTQRRAVRLAISFAALLVCAGPLPARAGEALAGGKKTLVIFAAASLKESFGKLAARFEEAHGVQVQLQFAGSQELRTQLEHGAKADLFASADQKHAEALGAAGLLRQPRVFATNEPVIAVAKGNPTHLSGLADLAKAGRLAVGVPEVPIGAYTAELLDRASKGSLGAGFRAQVESHVVSRELNVRQVLAKVALGEADAGIVYRTDVQAMAAKVDAVALPPELSVVASYPAGVLTGAAAPALAEEFLALLTGPAGQAVLREAGFGPPPAPVATGK